MKVDVEPHLSRIDEAGYTIIEAAVDDDLVTALAEDLARVETRLEARPATNRFEGTHTVRVYNLLARGGVWQQVPTHPALLPVVEAVLDPGCLVSSLSSVSIGPGETPQLLHADDQLIPLDRPHTATVCNSMWALTDFTEANGATRVVPGSHRFDHPPPYGEPQPTVPAEMARGSILVWHGSLWHGGGANTSREPRVGIAMNYCAGWIRQQENQQLGVPLDTLAGFSPRLRELCGLGVYRGLIGHIDKQSPAERLFADSPMTSVWEAADRDRPSGHAD
ncbi:MAG: phytanoyl-CoA dioxygenase family protein [Acidimicrobiales bacterium]